MKLQSYIVACRFHDITPSGQQLVAHVSWKGDVNKVLGAHLLSSNGNQITSIYNISFAFTVKSAIDPITPGSS